jgi:hypothetical protein
MTIQRGGLDPTDDTSQRSGQVSSGIKRGAAGVIRREAHSDERSIDAEGKALNPSRAVPGKREIVWTIPRDRGRGGSLGNCTR